MTGPLPPRPELPSWPDLFATALVGTARSRSEAGGAAALPRPRERAGEPRERSGRQGHSAEALLDVAAVHALRRRAGMALLPTAPPPEPAPVDDVAPVGPAAAARADALLALDHAGRDATPARDLASRLELLTEWLSAAAAAGRRLPPELVPALLDAGRRHRQLRPLIDPVAGPLAGWLATQRADWSYASASAPVEPAVEDQEVWEFGAVGRRAAYLRRLRERDPDRGRKLLETAWPAEPPEHRAVLLPALGIGLSGADEPLLEQALDDHRRQVREIGLDLLARLPGTGYTQRMADRAGECVRLHPDRIEVHPPDTCDRSMRRDGITPRPPARIGERAWWLEEILARAPLSVWPEPPALLAGLAVLERAGAAGGQWGPAVRRGLARAAAAQRHGAWAAALLDPLMADLAGRGTGRGGGWGPDDGRLWETLYRALPADELAARATAGLRRGPGGPGGGVALGAEQILALCRRPWPPTVAEAVFAVLADQLDRPGSAWRATGLCELAGLGFPADAAQPVVALVDRLRSERPGDRGLVAAERMAATVQFRHDLLEELASGH